MEPVCPRDHCALAREGDELVCVDGHRYPVVDGIPVLLVAEDEPTHGACWVSLEQNESQADTDAFVQRAIAATCGNLYRHLVGNLPAYPIPQIRRQSKIDLPVTKESGAGGIYGADERGHRHAYIRI